MPKGPSLREIQEAEAKKAAEQEAIAAAARRARAEQERLSLEHAPPPAPGLPATSTWGTNSSPGTPTAPQASVWAKQAAKPVVGTNAAAKKTLAQIQKEEEARKQRAVSAAAAAAAAAQVQTSSSLASGIQGKRYAELASKAVPSPVSGPAGAWMTVGSSGKAKAPATIVATPQAALPRSTSATVVPTAAAAKARPAMPPSRGSAVVEKNRATEEFSKWVKMSLGKGLNGGINGESYSESGLRITMLTIYSR